MKVGREAHSQVSSSPSAADELDIAQCRDVANRHNVDLAGSFVDSPPVADQARELECADEPGDY